MRVERENDEKDVVINVNNESPNTATLTGFFGDLVKMLKDYGFWKVFAAIFVLLFVYHTIINPSIINRAIEKYDKKKSEIEYKDRIIFNSYMVSLLDEGLKQLKCDKILFFELHNHYNTNVGGLSNINISLTYESVSDSLILNINQFQNQPLGLYINFIDELKKREMIVFNSCDNNINYRFINNFISQGYKRGIIKSVRNLNGNTYISGILVILYKDDIPDNITPIISEFLNRKIYTIEKYLIK